jgi:hypothetical protein
VLLEVGLGCSHNLDADELEATLLEAGDDVADKATLLIDQSVLIREWDWEWVPGHHRA